MALNIALRPVGVLALCCASAVRSLPVMGPGRHAHSHVTDGGNQEFRYRIRERCARESPAVRRAQPSAETDFARAARPTDDTRTDRGAAEPLKISF